LDFFGPCNPDNTDIEILWCKDREFYAWAGIVGIISAGLAILSFLVIYGLQLRHSIKEEKEKEKKDNDKMPLITKNSGSSEIIGERKKIRFPNVVENYALRSIVIDKNL